MRHLNPLRTAVLAVAALAVAAAPAGAATNPWLAKRVLDIAHQGGEDEFPSNTLYAFKQATKAGADMLELDIGVTRDDRVVVMHDTTVDRVTNGTGTVASHTLRQLRALDGSFWFSAHAGNHYEHGLKKASYRFRGVATGKVRPPKGYRASDFQVTTLEQVMAAFPHTPINIEIKGRTKAETDAEYLQNARVLAALLKGTTRKDLVVTSFHQNAVDLFHTLDPGQSLAPGIDGAAAFLLGNRSPGDGVQTFDLPFTYRLNGSELAIGTAGNIKRAHDAGYAWHSWFSDQDVDGPAIWRTLIADCADGIMTSQPVRLAAFLKTHEAPAACG
jgi:glycerophosphoryl diester phosphodiesterase